MNQDNEKVQTLDYVTPRTRAQEIVERDRVAAKRTYAFYVTLVTMLVSWIVDTSSEREFERQTHLPAWHFNMYTIPLYFAVGLLIIGALAASFRQTKGIATGILMGLGIAAGCVLLCLWRGPS